MKPAQVKQLLENILKQVALCKESGEMLIFELKKICSEKI